MTDPEQPQPIVPGATLSPAELKALYENFVSTRRAFGADQPLRLVAPPGWQPQAHYCVGCPIVYDARVTVPRFVPQG